MKYFFYRVYSMEMTSDFETDLSDKGDKGDKGYKQHEKLKILSLVGSLKCVNKVLWLV